MNSIQADIVAFPIKFTSGYSLAAIGQTEGRFLIIENGGNLSNFYLRSNIAVQYNTAAHWLAIGS